MRGGAPPDLQYADLATGNLTANTVSAFTALVAAPGANRRLRIWKVSGYFPTTTLIPARWYADFAFFGIGSRISRMSGGGYTMQQVDFPGGIASPNANEQLSVRWMVDIANSQLVISAHYTIEDI